ncbi:uncharacterized protein LOC136771907 [Amia ocellicauda]|uniref:uncharacterized protein LOC136771907 n=1 Tax=Amia ocellicauda TaxID=2972642 RepID=UPI0034646BA3
MAVDSERGLLLLLLLLSTAAPLTAVFLYSTLGASVTVPCDGLTEYHNSYIVWVFAHSSDTSVELSRGGMITDTDPDRAGRLRLGSNRYLHIDRLRTRDTGEYTCHQHVNGHFYESGSTVILFLLSISASPSEGLRAGDRITLSCVLDCGGMVGNCSETQGLTLSWRDESGVPLKDERDRYSITELRGVHSNLSVTLRQSDHNKSRTCVLTERGEMKTSESYTTTLSGVPDELFSTVGRLLLLPCVDPVSLGPGERLRWTYRQPVSSAPVTLYELLSQSITPLRGKDTHSGRAVMSVNSSLLIHNVQTRDAGLYRCERHKDLKYQKTHRRFALNTLSDVHKGFAVSLTCSLTCGFDCVENTELTWKNSTGNSLQGGASEHNKSTISSQLVLQPQSSERIWCSVEREGLERVSQDWTTEIKAGPGLAGSAVELAVRLTMFFIALIAPLVTGAVVYTKRRSSRQTEAVPQWMEMTSHG